jgi:hypothetical protein
MRRENPRIKVLHMKGDSLAMANCFTIIDGVKRWPNVHICLGGLTNQNQLSSHLIILHILAGLKKKLFCCAAEPHHFSKALAPVLGKRMKVGPVPKHSIPKV